MPVTPKQFQNLIGGYGFESYEEEALDIFNQQLGSLLNISTQKGGRVSMPADYFGYPTKAWTQTDAGTNPSMSTPTDTIVRPELPSTFQVGGEEQSLDKLFQVALKDFKQSGGGKTKRMSKEEKISKAHYFKHVIKKIFADIRKVATKAKKLKAVQIKRAFKKI
jgi:hypothetical protein